MFILIQMDAPVCTLNRLSSVAQCTRRPIQAGSVCRLVLSAIKAKTWQQQQHQQTKHTQKKRNDKTTSDTPMLWLLQLLYCCYPRYFVFSITIVALFLSLFRFTSYIFIQEIPIVVAANKLDLASTHREVQIEDVSEWVFCELPKLRSVELANECSKWCWNASLFTPLQNFNSFYRFVTLFVLFHTCS